MTPEEIKKTWAEASKSIMTPSENEIESMYRNNKMTALESLARRYRRFSLLGLAMIFCSFGWLSSQLAPINHTLWVVTVICMMVYFAICSGLDWWFYKGVSAIDCWRMSVREVSEKALYFRKKHLQSIMFLIPIAICVLGLIAFTLKADKYVLLGIVAGALTGGLLGYRQFKEFMSEYRKITEE